MVIPLVKPKDRVVSKDKKFTIKLRANPGDADSEKYEVTARPFNHRTPEEWIKHRKFVQTTIEGTGCTTGPGQFRLVRGYWMARLWLTLSRQWYLVPVRKR